MSEIIANLIARNRALEKRLNYLETQENNSSGEPAADILTKLLTVDGSGSGLDADLLDGYHASSFSLASHNHDSVYGRLAATNTWTQPNVFTVGGGNVRLSSSYYGPDLYVNTSGGWARQYTLRNDYAGATMRFGVGAYGDGSGAVRGYMGFRDGDENFYLSTLGINVLSNGNVGIGKIDPARLLDVSKAVSGTSFVPHLRLNDTGTVADTKGGIEFYNSQYSWSQGAVSTERQGSANAHDLVLYSGSGGSLVEGLRVSHEGYVGINYNAPFYPLQVFYDNPSNGIFAEFRNTHGASGNLGVKLNFYNSGIDAFRIGIVDATADFAFWSSGVNERVRIKSNGNVTISTPSSAVPTMSIDRYSGQPTVKSINAWLIMDSNGTGAALNYFATDPVVLAYGNGSGGGVAIGQTTVTSGYKLDVNGAIKSSQWWYQATTDAKIHIGTGGTLRFLDAASGSNLKVGIGITPQGQLHTFDGTGGTVHITQSNITSALLMTDGTGDIAYGAAINWVCRSSAGITQAGIAQVITPSSSYSDYAMFNAGGNTMVFRIYSDGRLYLIRTAGSASFYVSAHITYL